MSPNLLSDRTRAGIFHVAPSRLPELLANAGDHQFRLRQSDLSECSNIDHALAALGHDFGFPDWYGANFDALMDCLTDPDWHQGQDLVLSISGLTTLRKRSPTSLPTLIEVLRSAADSHSASGNILWILLTDPVRGVCNLPDA